MWMVRIVSHTLTCNKTHFVRRPEHNHAIKGDCVCEMDSSCQCCTEKLVQDIFDTSAHASLISNREPSVFYKGVSLPTAQTCHTKPIRLFTRELSTCLYTDNIIDVAFSWHNYVHTHAYICDKQYNLKLSERIFHVSSLYRVR